MTEAKLQKIFGAYGEVAQSRVLDSSGYAGDSIALVRMKSTEEAVWVVKNLHGNIPKGLSKPVRIRFAESRGAKTKKPQFGATQSSTSERPRHRSQPRRDSP